MKTIIARFEDMKKDPMAILEDGVSANKVEAALATIGIALRDSEGEFRALQDVMDELGMKWESLTRNQQAYIATVAAGSRQQSRFLAMMNNYDRTLDLITESQNSAGAAAQQYATYQDSIAAAQARLTASWENFYSKIVDNDLIKTAINGLSKLIDLLAKVPPSITAIGVTIGALRLQKYLTDNGGILGVLKKTLSSGVKDAGKKSALDLITEFSDTSIKELTKQSPTIVGAFKHVGTGITGVLSSIVTGFVGVTKAVAAFVAANWEVMAIVAGVALVIDGLTKLINAQKIAYEKNIEEIRKLNEEANELLNKSNNSVSLFKVYDDLSNKISLTDDEQIELNNTIKQIGEIYPEAITYLDEYGNMQIANAEQIRDTIEAEKQLAQERKKQALEKRGEILEKSEDQWTKESLEEVGINSNLTSAYFTNKELIKTYKSGNKDRPLEQIDEFAKEVLKERALDWSDEYRENLIKKLNKINKEYKLGLKELKETTKDNNVIIDYYEAIANYDYNEVIRNLENTNNKIVKTLQKNNNIELSFANLKFSDNSSIATSQRILASQIQAMFEKMDIDVWESLFGEDGNPEDFAKKIQEIIDVVSKDNALELTQLFKDFNAGKISVEEFKDKFKEIAKLAEGAGVDSAVAFAESFGDQLDNQLDKEKEKFLNYFENIGVSAEVRVNKAEELQLGQGQIYQNYAQNYLTNSEGKVMAYATAKLFEIPAEQIQQFEQQVKEAVEAGDASALVDIQTQWIETWGTIDEEVANLLINGRIVEAFQQFSKDYVSEIAEAASGLFGKKDYSSIDIAEGTNYYNAFNEFNGTNSFWDHATIDENGKLQLDYYAQIKVAQEDINNSVQTYNDKITDAKADLATNKELTEDQKKELQNCINYWEEAIKKIRKASDGIEVIIGQTKELSNLTLDWAITLEKTVNSSSENIKALQVSSDAAKEYKEVIDVVEKLEEDIKKIGHVSRENMDALMAHGDFYQDFFTIDEETGIIQLNNMVENYANAADAIKAIARNRQEFELEMKKQEIEAEAKKARDQADAYDILAQIFYDYANEVNTAQGQMTQTEREELAKQYTNQVTEAKKGLEAADTNYNALMKACEDTYRWMSTLDAKYWANIGKDGIANIVETAIAQRKTANAAAEAASGDIINLLVNGGGVADLRKQGDQFKSMADSLRAYADSLEASKDRLKIIDPTVYDDMAKKLEGTGKAGKEAGDKIAKAIKNAADAIIKLNDLIDEVKKNLKDITVNYNPFMDLFEAWEHEWDYYYNIKNLIAQLGQQGEWIDNVISSDYSSATEKLAAYDAKIGNITSKMAANDAYILTLRQGIAQNALKLEKEFGQYYNVDNVMGSWQVYQKDTNLHEWNDVANAVKKTSYELSKVINQQENELSLLEATQDALEQERSAYESILSTVDGLIDSLKDDEDITVDLSQLQGIKAELEVAIKDESVEHIKEQIRNLNDYVQELNWQLDLNDNVILDGIDDAVEDMEELRDKVQEYIDTLNETITQQQELLQELVEVYNYYIDTAISTEQELYDAIVENYQNEINQKKKQYDYLKQLDNDYLRAIKDNINKERQAREEANKQKSYQQNIQRAQLLSMDTSGAYRKELANLNKEIENQRQDLYDDLVDKQVEALEKEIEKRHELYDMEVAALEERLAYMQENAILLWEMVNNIVADGSEAMMSTLENTIDYINSNELNKERQRRQWELSIQTTIKGVVDSEIENLKARIDKGNEYIKSIEEIKAAIELNTETYQQSTTILIEENEKYQTAMEAFMQSWTNMTNGMTGYYENWQTTVNNIKLAIERDIEELTALGEDGGGIQELESKLKQSAEDMYNSFIEERQSYKNQLTRIIQQIETQISAAIQKAANAIQNAANSIKINPVSNGGDYGGGGYQPTPTTPTPGSPTPAPAKKYYFTYKMVGPNGEIQENKSDSFNTYEEASKGLEVWKNYWIKLGWKFKSWGVQSFLKGGVVDFTGPAWLDGTKSNPEAVLNPKQTRLFESMVSSLERASNNSNINSSFGSSYNVGDINTSINVAKLDNQTDIDKVAKAVEDKIVKTIRNRVSISINKGV